MREIKFRAYIAEDNKIYDVLTVMKNMPSESFQRVFINKERGEGMPANYRITAGNVLMEFTGLQDKNGKDIYEGDIIKSFGLEMKEENFEVSFSDGRFHVRSLTWTSTYSSLSEKTMLGAEIIGNIYENPDLLAGKP